MKNHKPVKFRPMTKLQYACLFKGCQATAAYLMTDPEQYRKMILRAELGLESFKEVDRVHGFEQLMRRILLDRGEYSRAMDYVAGDEKRLRHLALEAAKAIVRQSHPVWYQTSENLNNIGYRYVAGVMVQMRMSLQTVDSLAMKLQRDDGWDDFTDLQLKRVVSALQVHIRRHS